MHRSVASAGLLLLAAAAGAAGEAARMTVCRNEDGSPNYRATVMFETVVSGHVVLGCVDSHSPFYLAVAPVDSYAAGSVRRVPVPVARQVDRCPEPGAVFAHLTEEQELVMHVTWPESCACSANAFGVCAEQLAVASLDAGTGEWNVVASGMRRLNRLPRPSTVSSASGPVLRERGRVALVGHHGGVPAYPDAFLQVRVVDVATARFVDGAEWTGNQTAAPAYLAVDGAEMRGLVPGDGAGAPASGAAYRLLPGGALGEPSRAGGGRTLKSSYLFNVDAHVVEVGLPAYTQPGGGAPPAAPPVLETVVRRVWNLTRPGAPRASEDALPNLEVASKDLAAVLVRASYVTASLGGRGALDGDVYLSGPGAVAGVRVPGSAARAGGSLAAGLQQYGYNAGRDHAAPKAYPPLPRADAHGNFVVLCYKSFAWSTCLARWGA